MRKTSYSKKALLYVTFLVTTILLLASCSHNKKPDDTKDVAEDRNAENLDTNKQKNDAQFLVNTAEINLEEIQLGQLAQQKGIAPHVKELGKMMEDAHTKSLHDLRALAQSKGITIPTSPTDDAKSAYAKLDKKSANDFDKAYADKMVSSHKDAIETFEKASTNSNDPDIRNWATAALPELRTHLDHSLECQMKCDKR